MKALYKIATISAAVSMLASSILFPGGALINTASADNGPCDGWVLQWSDGSAVNSSDFMLPPVKLSVSPGDPAYSTSTPPGTATTNPDYNASTMGFVLASSSPQYGKNNSLQWTCSNYSSPSSGLTSSQQPQGTEACIAAAQIAAKYGAYTALNANFSTLTENIKNAVVQKVIDNLKNQFSNVHINISNLLGTSTLGSDLAGLIGNNPTFTDVQNLFTSSGLQDAFTKTFGDPMKKQVQGQVDAITKEASQQLAEIGINVLGSAATQIKDITNLGGSFAGIQSVPVNDAGTQAQLKEVQKIQEKAIQEQKTQEVIAQTRSQCDLLLKSTVETIKRSLLYEFTSETVNWIQGGGIQFSNGKIIVKAPQYFSQPLKSLADAGLTAVDRLISQVAPQLCQPFRLAVTFDIPTVSKESNPYYQQVSCTLNQVVGNIQNFYENFRSGSWLGYQEMWMPQNNYYGASLQVQGMAQAASVGAQSALQNEMNQGNGYKNKYQCNQWEEYTQVPTNLAALYSISGVPLGKDIQIVNGVYYQGQPVDSANGIPSDAQTTVTNSAYISGSRLFTDTNNTMFYECSGEPEIVQPSNIAAGLAQQSTQVDVQSLINAQDLTDIGDIIQRAIINKLTKVGIGGLQGVLQKLPGLQNRLQILNP